MFRMFIVTLRKTLSGALVGTCVVASAWAQAPADRTQAEPVKPLELKRQIEELQSQLRKLEVNSQQNERVAEIGSRYQQREAGLIVRLYDLNDLFATAPSYAAHRFDDFQLGDEVLFSGTSAANTGPSGGGTGGMGGGGVFAVPSQPRTLPVGEPPVAASMRAAGSDGKNGQGARGAASESRTSIHTLVDAITSTIAPTSWDEVGGEGSIALIGNSLLISTELKNHEQIESLLGLFRQRWKTLRTVTVRAYWLWLNDEQLAALVPEPVDDKTPYGVVDDKAWRNRPAADPKLGAGYRAMLTCYNGQTVHVAAGGERLSITDMQVEKAEPMDEKHQASMIYRPTAVALQDGAALQIRPVVSNSGKFVALDLHSRVARLDPSPPAKAEAKHPDSLQDVVGSIDRPRVAAQRLSTTLRVPINRVVLVGGMTFDGAAPQNDASLCLFVRATVQDLTDDTQAAPAERAR